MKYDIRNLPYDKVTVSPSILAADFGTLDADVAKAAAAGADVTAYYVKSAFQPEFELRDAKRLSEELGAKMTVIDLDVLSDSTITANPADRCYHCKKRIFTAIVDAARADGGHRLLAHQRRNVKARCRRIL